jgi:predicted acylesterase/phospholipase RssA
MYDNEINKIIDIFIDNLPDHFKNTEKPMIIDLILDGGSFNGGYLLGALYFLKEMEKRKYIKIARISGCSIGSLLGFLYLTDNLNCSYDFYNQMCKSFKENLNFQYYKDIIQNFMKNKLSDDVYNKINNVLFIKYNTIKNGTKIKSYYKNNDEIIETIIRSSFIPYIFDGNILYKEKYFDAINPYIFKKRNNRKIIFLDLSGLDKIQFMFNIKNEKNTLARSLIGLTEIYMFFIKQTDTSICSSVNNWSYYRKIRFYIRYLLEKIIYYIIYFIIFIKKYTNTKYYKHHIIYKILSKLSHDIYIMLIDNYCI